MKKLISFILVCGLMVTMVAVSVSAYSWSDSGIMTVDEALGVYEQLHGEEVATNRYYFLMPNGSNGEIGDDASNSGRFGEYAPTWFMELSNGNKATKTAGIYGWDSNVVNPSAWVGYLPSGFDENDANVFYADVPQDVKTIIWNNAVDSGIDATMDTYYCGAQTVNIACEYYEPGDSQYYPNGTDDFNNMIFVIDPDYIKINVLSGKQTCGGEWFYYYGDGCYGFIPDGNNAHCIRKDHNHPENGDIEIPSESPVYPPIDQESQRLYFEPDTAGWNNYKKIYCHITDCETGESVYSWQSKRASCSYSQDGRWYYDLSAKGVELIPGNMYSCIFSNENGMQTYDLLFDLTCLEDTAYCDGTKYENPDNHTKVCVPAFWRNQDKENYGPKKCITSIGNVIGTCVTSEESAYAMFESFLANSLNKARTYSGKSDQQLIDDIGEAFCFDKDSVEECISKTGISIDWNTDESRLPQRLVSMPEIDKAKLEYKLDIDTNSIWGAYGDYFYCHIYSESKGITFYSKGDEREACVKNEDGTWTYYLDVNGIELQPNIVYQVQFYSALPTVPEISPININSTYMDYTLYYDFVGQSYKWKYRETVIGYTLGDVDGDSKVSVMDATTIQRYIAQLTTIPENKISCADTDKDTRISIMDATMIQRFIAKLIPSL